jgi:hypothetical protein
VGPRATRPGLTGTDRGPVEPAGPLSRLRGEWESSGSRLLLTERATGYPSGSEKPLISVTDQGIGQ